jgi:hypothetical protein
LAVEFADDLRTPMLAEVREFLCEVHLVHRSTPPRATHFSAMNFR